MEVILTQHAKERMLERIGCSEDKLVKIATKAWKSTDFCKYQLTQQNRTKRSFLGYTFIFDPNSDLEDRVILVTVFK